MSLTKKMTIFVISILLTILAGTFILDFNHTKSYLEAQLESHAQDSATSLGLSLSSVADLEDSSSMETMINAVFDRGDYTKITLTNTNNKPIYFREKTNNIESVPNWFISIISIQAPRAEALIQSGWMPIGKLKVESAPELAYTKLWNSTIAIAIWFLIATIFTVFLAYVTIKTMLRPLKKMEEQAEAIVRKECFIQENLPNTTEFRQVVLAMNTMINKIKTIFDRDAKIAEKLQKIAYQDKVTGLSNRTHFEMNIEPLLDQNQEATGGIICMIRIHDLKKLNDESGYLIGDKFIQLLTNKVQLTLAQKDTFCARLNGTEIIIVVPSAASDSIMQAMKTIYEYLPEINKKINIPEKFINLSIGVIDYQPGDKRQQLLAKLDYAIDKSQENLNSYIHYEANNNQKVSNEDWQKTINDAMQENRFLLFQQTTYTDKNQAYSKELFIRLKDLNNKIQSAGYFMPTVQQLGRGSEIDQLVFSMAIKYLMSLDKNTNENIAINLTTIEDNHYIHNIQNKLKTINPNQLSFETTEKLIINNKAAIQSLIKQLKTLGIRFGIDNFGSHFSNMVHLQTLLPSYIKLDPSFNKSIETDEQTISYIASLVDMCQSLDIDIIAMAIENKRQLQAFNGLGINLYQGYFFDAPKLLQK